MAGTESGPEQDLAKELAARTGGRRVGRLTLVLAGLVLVVGGFAGGVVFNRATASAGAETPGQTGQPGQFVPGQGGTRTPGSFAQDGGFVSGTITAISGDTVTVKLADGSTKRVTTSSSTVDQLKTGDTVVVRGDATDDGTVTAQSIAEGEQAFGTGGQRQPGN